MLTNIQFTFQIFIVNQYNVMPKKRCIGINSVFVYFKLPAYICISVLHIMLYRTAVFCRKIDFNYQVFEPFY